MAAEESIRKALTSNKGSLSNVPAKDPPLDPCPAVSFTHKPSKPEAREFCGPSRQEPPEGFIARETGG